MQGYICGDFSKLYPWNIFKMAPNLYIEPINGTHDTGFLGSFKKTCLYITNPPCQERKNNQDWKWTLRVEISMTQSASLPGHVPMTIEISVSHLLYYQTSIKRSPYKQFREVNGLWSRILWKLSAADQEKIDYFLTILTQGLRAEDISFVENGWEPVSHMRNLLSHSFPFLVDFSC